METNSSLQKRSQSGFLCSKSAVNMQEMDSKTSRISKQIVDREASKLLSHQIKIKWCADKKRETTARQILVSLQEQNERSARGPKPWPNTKFSEEAMK